MKTITLRFVTESAWQSALIRWQSASRFSHAGALITAGELRELGMWAPRRAPDDTLYELGARSGVDGAISGNPGVQLRPADYAKFTDLAVVPIPVSAAEYADFWRGMALLSGQPYSMKTILGFVLGRDLDDRHGFVCSVSLAFVMLNDVGLLPGCFHPSVRRLTPGALYDIAETIAFIRKKAISMAGISVGER